MQLGHRSALQAAIIKKGCNLQSILRSCVASRACLARSFKSPALDPWAPQHDKMADQYLIRDTALSTALPIAVGSCYQRDPALTWSGSRMLGGERPRISRAPRRRAADAAGLTRGARRARLQRAEMSADNRLLSEPMGAPCRGAREAAQCELWHLWAKIAGSMKG